MIDIVWIALLKQVLFKETKVDITVKTNSHVILMFLLNQNVTSLNKNRLRPLFKNNFKQYSNEQ